MAQLCQSIITNLMHWRQYDLLVNLLRCICENSKKLKNHNQHLKLMQFLMGLDEVYAPIRSIILTTDPIRDVKGAFSTLSRDESRRSTQSHNVSKNGNGNSVFMVLRISYLFASSNTFTKRLMALISEKPRSGSIPANVAGYPSLCCLEGYKLYSLESKKMFYSRDVKFYEIVFPFKHSSKCKENEMHYQKTNSLNFFDFEDNCILDDPYNEWRDKESEISESIDPISSEGTENTGDTRRDEGEHPDDTVHQQKQSDSINLRRSSKKAGMPAKLSDFHIDTKMCEPKTYNEAFSDIEWVEVMNLEMKALNRNNTWVITEFPYGGKAIGTIPGCLICSAGEWVYDEGVAKVGCYSGNLHASSLSCGVARFVAAVCIGNDLNEINKVKEFLKSKFMIKDLGKLKYFLGIEVLESGGSLILTQRKYCLELLSEFGMLACKPCKTPIKVKASNVKKNVIIDEPLVGITNYQKLVGKLIYLTDTRPDISYAVHVLSHYMHAPMQSYLKHAFRVLSKKQSVLAKSSAEARYGATNSVTCKVIWIMKILNELNVKVSLHVTINCDNSLEIQMAANPVFHERTKHFEIELFFLREKLAASIVKTVKVKSEDNVANVFTKGLSVVDHNKFCTMLKLKDLYHN
ncbi:ribonuclease H-like domain-containing protein [Tanacetum coccineum]